MTPNVINDIGEEVHGCFITLETNKPSFEKIICGFTLTMRPPIRRDFS